MKLTLLFSRLGSSCKDKPTGVTAESLNLASSDPVIFLNINREDGWRSIDLLGEI